jgi:hypothetical protein
MDQSTSLSDVYGGVWGVELEAIVGFLLSSSTDHDMVGWLVGWLVGWCKDMFHDMFVIVP